jgi:hypothetical protein
MPTIDYAPSIGPNCRAKYHLRRRYARFAVNGVFDWQVTPPRSCIAYLEADFVGVFERQDLEIRDGSLRNRKWGTSYFHELSELTEAALDRRYPTGRSRHDHLCQNFRSTIRSGKRVLLAFSQGIDEPTRQELVAALRAYAGDTELHFVFEPQDGGPWPSWRGDEKLWNALLAPYRLPLWPSLMAAGMRAGKAVLRRARKPKRERVPPDEQPAAGNSA